MIFVLAFALPLTLFLSKPSCFWNFDGVACAAALELGNPVYFFHADHLLYGALGFLFWKFFLLPLGVTRALPALQLFTSVLSALSMVAVFVLLHSTVRLERGVALMLTLAISATAVVWVWSIEAQVYALGFMGLALATAILLGRAGENRYRWVGFWHAVGVLGHLMHVLWALPAVYWIWTEDRPSATRGSRLREYLLWMTGTTAAAYLSVYAFVLRPAHLTPMALSNWLKGSAGLTGDRHWAWHHDTGLAPLHWLHTTAGFFWGSFWPYTGHTSTVVWAITAFSVVVVLALLLLSFRRKGAFETRVRYFTWSWIALYGLFLWSWEPMTLCYRMTEAVPFALLLALGLRAVSQAWITYALAGGLLVSLLAISWTTRIEPMNRSSLNPTYTETMRLVQETPASSLYLTGGGLPWIYLLYFSGRQAWDVHHLPTESVSQALRARARDQAVYLRSDVYAQGSSTPWIILEHWIPLPDIPWRRMRS